MGGGSERGGVRRAPRERPLRTRRRECAAEPGTEAVVASRLTRTVRTPSFAKPPRPSSTVTMFAAMHAVSAASITRSACHVRRQRAEGGGRRATGEEVEAQGAAGRRDARTRGRARARGRGRGRPSVRAGPRRRPPRGRGETDHSRRPGPTAAGRT